MVVDLEMSLESTLEGALLCLDRAEELLFGELLFTLSKEALFDLLRDTLFRGLFMPVEEVFLS